MGDFKGNLIREYWNEALDVNFWRNVLKSSSSAARPLRVVSMSAANRQKTKRIAFIYSDYFSMRKDNIKVIKC
jgi:hypothetical protein